ncbi:MAG: MFS transporter [Candidatus Eisenbacteria bacterium]
MPEETKSLESGAGQGGAPGLMDNLRTFGRASRGFWLVNSVNFGDGIAYFGFLGLLTLFLQKNAGFTTGGATMGVSLFSGLVTLTMALGGGWISDRLGVRRALSLSMFIILVGRVLLVGSPGLGAEFLVQAVAWASLVVMAAGEGIVQPALYSGVKEYTDSRAATLGYAFLYSIMNLGIVVGELLSPFVREKWAAWIEGVDVNEVPTAGISGSYWFFIGITAIVLLVNLFAFTKKVEERDRSVVEKPEEDAHLSFWRKLRSLPIMDARFLFFIFILLPVRTLFAHQFLTMPDYVTRAFPPEVGRYWEWVYAINPAVIVIGVPLIAAFTQRRKVLNMMIAGTTVSALASFILVPETSVTLLVAYMVIWSLGEAIWSSRFLEYVANLAPAHRVGIYMGIAGIPWFLAKTVTGFYAGSMLEKYVPVSGPQDPGTLWLIYGLTALATPIGLVAARKWLGRVEEPRSRL